MVRQMSFKRIPPLFNETLHVFPSNSGQALEKLKYEYIYHMIGSTFNSESKYNNFTEQHLKIHLQNSSHFVSDSMSMVWCKKDVTPLLTHWSYIFLALTHQCITTHGVGGEQHAGPRVGVELEDGGILSQ